MTISMPGSITCSTAPGPSLESNKARRSGEPSDVGGHHVHAEPSVTISMPGFDRALGRPNDGHPRVLSEWKQPRGLTFTTWWIPPVRLPFKQGQGRKDGLEVGGYHWLSRSL